MKKYLCVFAHEHVNFRLQELVAISHTLNHPIEFNEREYRNDSPFLVISAPSDEAVKQISERSVLLKSVVELWGEGRTYPEVAASFAAKRKALEHFFCDEVSFRVRMDCFSKKCTPEKQREILDNVDFLPFKGKVCLKSPDVTVSVHEDYGPSSNSAPSQPLRVFIGRRIGSGQRHLSKLYSIKTRYFIGNTTMDPQLSLIMANQAKVTHSSLVFDPFVGSGSILIGCAHFGGHVMGADINSVLLHGRGRPSRTGTNQKWRSSDESILSNLVQYQLQSKYVDAIVADAARVVWRGENMFDAIVTDPPYGVREGARKVGKDKGPVNPVSPENQEGHISAVCSYGLSNVYQDLLDFAAKFLVLGGRLVYWLPVVQHEYDPSLLPQHPCLRLVANSEQPLSGSISRRLVTMEKVEPYKDTLAATSEGVSEDFRAKYFKYSGVKPKAQTSHRPVLTGEDRTGRCPQPLQDRISPKHKRQLNQMKTDN
jgi:tRNA (guanine10-N2)-methyltransferase